MGLRMQAVIVNCHDPARLAEFWAAALGWRITAQDEPEWVVEPPEGSREDSVVPDLLFIEVPDAKRGPNRLHIDLTPDGDDEDQAAAVARLEALGATRADVGQDPSATWVVLADPEGNELCVLSPYPPELRTRWQARYDAYQPDRRAEAGLVEDST